MPLKQGRDRPDPAETLGELALEIAQGESDERALHHLVSAAMRSVDAAGGAIALYNPYQQSFDWSVMSDAALLPEFGQLLNSVARRRAAAARMWLVIPLAQNGKTSSSAAALASHSVVACVPLVYHQQFHGILVLLLARTFTVWRDDEYARLDRLTRLGASVLYRRQLQAQLDAMQAQLVQAQARERAFIAFSQIIARTAELPIIAERLLASLSAFVAFDEVEIWMREQRSHFECIARRLGNVAALPHKSKPSLALQTIPLLRDLLIRQQPIRISDLTTVQPRPTELFRYAQGSWLLVPILNAGLTTGFLSLYARTTAAFTAEHEYVAKMFCQQFGMAVQNSRLFERAGTGREHDHAVQLQVLKAQEEERKRLSRELHDEAGQSLTALTINLELLQQELAGQSQDILKRARESIAITRQTMERMRNLARQLRPPTLDLLGLEGALRDLCHTMARRSQISIQFSASDIGKLDDEVSLVLYRVTQEALTNAVRHAHATLIDVALQVKDNVLLVSVRDNGTGFDVEKQLRAPRRRGRLGLVGMRERIVLSEGQLDIVSQPGEGTLILARVPVPPNLAQPEPEA